MAWQCADLSNLQTQKVGNDMSDKKNGEIKTRLIALADWPKHHPWPPLGGLRHLVFYAKTNGFDQVIRRASGRVLIDEAAFFQWVEQNNKNS